MLHSFHVLTSLNFIEFAEFHKLRDAIDLRGIDTLKG
jgi:hypothetical protein